MLSAAEVEALARAGESETVEFKLERERQPDLGELFSAMANGHGGTVLVGVTDDGQIIGVSQVRELDLRIHAAARGCKPSLEEWLETYTVEVSGKTIVVVHIPAREDAVYSYGGSYRIRRGAANVSLSDTQITDLVLRRRGGNFDQRVAYGVSLDDLDDAALNDMLQGRSERSGMLEERSVIPTYPSPAALNRLAALKVLREEGGGLVPTNAGILMAGRKPQSVLPEATIQIARFRGIGMSQFLDRAELYGTIPEQLRAALAFIARNTTLASYIGAVERADSFAYPPTAVREAVANALLHRDYTQRAKVNISIYDDRITIINPGELLPSVSISHIAGSHRLRNHTIGDLMFALGLVESWGSGIPRMMEALNSAGLPAPAFQSADGWFSVTLYGQGIDSSKQRPVVIAPSQGAEPIVVAEQWKGLGVRQLQLLQEFTRAQGGSITTTEYAAKFGISPIQALRDLRGLVEAGLLQRTGGSKHTKYMMRWHPETLS